MSQFEFDSAGRPVCARCRCLVFDETVFCEQCLDIVLREVEARSSGEKGADKPVENE